MDEVLVRLQSLVVSWREGMPGRNTVINRQFLWNILLSVAWCGLFFFVVFLFFFFTHFSKKSFTQHNYSSDEMRHVLLFFVCLCVMAKKTLSPFKLCGFPQLTSTECCISHRAPQPLLFG